MFLTRRYIFYFSRGLVLTCRYIFYCCRDIDYCCRYIVLNPKIIQNRVFDGKRGFWDDFDTYIYIGVVF
jgi:hypothetical protein